MLQIDHTAEIVRLRWTLPRTLSERWALRRGMTLRPERWHTVDIEHARDAQQVDPVPMVHADGRALWWFRDHFYWDADGRSRDEIRALVLGDPSGATAAGGATAADPASATRRRRWT